jgi:O-antigen ligase
MILFVGWLFKKMNVKMIVKKTFLIAAIAYCFFFLFSVLAPADLILSVKASSVVVFEAFDLQTFQLIFNPNEALNSENWKLFSSSGNTLFRVLAWAQTLDDILSEKLGWLWGLPMGRNYSWVGPGGIFNENMQPHNDYLVIMSRTGISGLIAYLALITYIVNNVRRLVLQGMESKQITILICFLIMLLLFVGLNAEIRSYGMHFWVWFLMGFILREVKLFKEKSYE